MIDYKFFEKIHIKQVKTINQTLKKKSKLKPKNSKKHLKYMKTIKKSIMNEIKNKKMNKRKKKTILS